ncbi:tRNA-guanine transglycosylase family protein [Sporothrix brasiliensis 5110]|uniref:tRNA-guanine transglycosylase family protein n=1 Tax=Sporothrix brasiliensis 5110 TaxID=1398154 RepID=A0A0C2EKQ3_9PEZI|nr:tRNA-guanine transglycosylase family protein [Sporothrix brasiliensis 5110]KIH86629.1 tRNA-guanine transglycosylase family protein [Sporothrix brasiliensis 5110]
MSSDPAGPLDPTSLSSPPSPPDGMPPPIFRIIKTAASSVGNGSGSAVAADEAFGRSAVPRLGTLVLPGRTPVPTPNFFPVTSRGAVPHVTPDNAVRTGLVNGAYFALEDSAASHLGNGPSHISIVTSTGFQKLTLNAYHAAIDNLRPDIAVPMADLTYGGGTITHMANNTPAKSSVSDYVSVPHPAAKRGYRMAERTEDWIDQVERDGVADATGIALFAPTLPVPYATQWQYLNRLAELARAGEADEAVGNGGAGKARPTVAGLAVYDVDLLPDLHADYADTLVPLPRLSLHPAVTPHHILRQVGLGIDIMLLPAVTDASEQGLSYTFSWAATDVGSGEQQNVASGESSAARLPLAMDLTDPVFKADTRPLRPGCPCGACTAHHRAYIHHLLDAREMLAWTLLQVHNHHVMRELFAGIRATLADEGVAGFQRRARQFQTLYETDMPVGRATRPRLRGYQVKTDGVVEAPLNKPQWGRLEEVPPTPAGDTMAVDA